MKEEWFKEWAAKHRGTWIFILIVLGFAIGFIQPLALHSQNVFQQGFTFGFIYSVLLVVVELAYGESKK